MRLRHGPHHFDIVLKANMTLTKNVMIFRWSQAGGDPQPFMIDAQSEDINCFGRLIQHSKLNPNCGPDVVELYLGVPCLVLRPLRNVKRGELLTYDYGDRRVAAINNFAWLKQ